MSKANKLQRNAFSKATDKRTKSVKRKPITEVQPNNLLHNLKLADLLQALVDEYGWEGLGQRIDIRCFTHNPSMNSSLKFLRRTSWARNKVESLYIQTFKD